MWESIHVYLHVYVQMLRNKANFGNTLDFMLRFNVIGSLLKSSISVSKVSFQQQGRVF